MTRSVDELWQLLQEAASLPYGAAQIALVEQVMRHADAAGDRHLAFAVRMLATTAYMYGGEQAKSFVTFSWCRSEFDNEPAPYHERYAHDLLWYFKWMVTGLTKFPDVPLPRTHAVLDDMERRYREGGHSLQAVYKHRHLVARHVGAEDEADEWYERWITTPRDSLSDCAGCDPSAQARHLSHRGRYDEAIALAEPVLAGDLSCTEQPQGILTALLTPYLRTGRLDAAADAHRRSYRRVRANLADLSNIGEHIGFCVRTGNDARGLEILQRHLDWLDRAPSPAAAMNFAAWAAALLRRLTDSGHGDTTVHRGEYLERPAADLPVAELAAELTGYATGLATRFDSRNGTGAQGRHVAEILDTGPSVQTWLPLSPTARRAGTPAADRAGGLDASATTPPVPADADAAQLLELAEEYDRADRSAAVTAVLRAFDERFGGEDLAPVLAAQRADLRGARCFDAHDAQAAESAWQEAAELYAKAGDEGAASRASGRLGLLRCLTGRAEEGLRLVESDVAVQAQHGDARRRAGAYLRLSTALFVLGRAEQALAARDRADAAMADVDAPYQKAGSLLDRAQILVALQRQDEALRAARAGVQAYRTLGGDRYPQALLTYARLLDDPAAALAAFDEALATGSRDVDLDARAGRGRALLALDRAAEAVDEFIEVVAAGTERGHALGAAFGRYELAGAYRRAGRPLEAAEVAEEAVSELQRLDEREAADRCRYLLAHVYRETGDDDAALAVYEVLAGNLSDQGERAGRAQVLEEAGDVLYRKDRDEQAAQRYAAAAAEYRAVGAWLDELRALRRSVLARHWAGDADGAQQALAEARQRHDDVGADAAQAPDVVWERAMLDVEATRILMAAGRYDDALPAIRSAPERLRGIDAFGEAAQAELTLAELLLRLGRPAEAEPLVRAVLPATPRQARGRLTAAALLAEALDRLDRGDEAAAVRVEHGLSDGRG